MKKYIALAMVLCLALSGCGKKDKDKDKSTTETTTEMTTMDESESESISEGESKASVEATTVKGQKAESSNSNSNKQQATTKETQAYIPPEETYTKQNPKDSFEPNASGSPLLNVSGEVYKAVSDDVRDYANPSYQEKLKGEILADNNTVNQNIQAIEGFKAKWKSQFRLPNDEKFAKIGYQLITGYSQLAKAEILLDAYSDQIPQADKDLYNSIEDDLSANVEIFLNMDDISTVDTNQDFSCSGKINQFLQNIKPIIGE